MLKLSITFIFLFFFSIAQIHSQEDHHKFGSVTFVFSQNKCHFNNLLDLQELTINSTGPILNELVKEGLLIDWGILSHDWGDEWNFNNYYIAEDKAKFNKAWQEYVKRLNKKDSTLWKKFGEYCTEHKDNIYHQYLGANFLLNDNK
jgi:hypothetical protein